MAKTIFLKYKKSFFISPKPPYNFDATVFKPSHYPDPMTVHETGKYWFVMRLNNKIYGIKMENKGCVNNPKVRITVFSEYNIPKNELKNIINELDFRFEFNRDISGFCKKFRRDKILSPFLKKWHGMHGSCAHDLYGLLMISVFLQNTVVRRSVAMTQAMLEKHGIKTYFDGKKVYIFWKPEKMVKLPEEELRKLKVGYRAKIFIRLSRTFIEEKIDEFKLRKMPAEEAKKKMLKLYGVGPETVRILLTEALHHYDVFEHVAPWQQKIYSRLLFNKNLVSSGKIIDYIKFRWGEWASLAASYIWEDIFWQKKHGKKIAWLEKEIRL